MFLQHTGTAQQVYELGGGPKEECVKEIFWGAGGACLWISTIKLMIFFHIFSDVAIGPENSQSLN